MDKESDEYFASRPRGSQIGAWASWQSQPITDRQALVDKFKDAEKQYEGKVVVRPPYWGGYVLVPLRIEFWQEREFRLHDRFLYSRAIVTDPWKIERLQP